MTKEKLLSTIKKEIDNIEKEIKTLKADKQMYYEIIKSLDKKINDNILKLNNIKIKYNVFNDESFISDHALLRYLQRTNIIDIQQLKTSLLSEEVVNAIYNGANKLIYNGLEYVIKNGKIVTIIKVESDE